MRNKKRTRNVARSSTTDLEEFKAFLGPCAQDYTDVELRQLRSEMKAMADILVDLYLAKHKGRDLGTIDF